MIRLLKILSVFTIILAIAAIVLLGTYILGEKSAPDGVLAQQGAVDKFKQGGNATDKTTDKVAPLVLQAELYANMINPPPPPVIPGANNTIIEVAEGDDGRKTRERVTPPPPTKFKLVATCKYENQPEKSLALINLSAKGDKWFRQGEAIEHLTLHEVKDGSVVLYQSGRLNSELFMPEEKTDSLLKSEANTSAAPQLSRTASRASRTSRPVSTRRTAPPQRTVQPVAKQPPVVRTPEQEKAQIDDNIKNVRNIMTGEDQTKEDKEMMATLLRLLQDDKDRVEEEVKKTKKTPPKNQKE